MHYVKVMVLIMALTACGISEKKVFLNETFPYRVVCASTWVEVERNDTLFIVQNSIPGKRTQLQLRKYPFDSGYPFEEMQWSRLNYAVNRELADGVGEILSSDTSIGKKLGGGRAFELFALYSQKVGENTVWWAEYGRWTERNNCGYLAVIVGDTLDLQLDLEKENSAYKALLDSIDIMQLPTSIAEIRGQPRPVSPSLVIRKTPPTETWYTLLGKKALPPALHRSTILVRRSEKTLLLREMHAP